MKDIPNEPKDQSTDESPVPKVTGIGGIFFFSEDPEETKKWYAANLGLEVNEWGSSFEFRNAHRPDEINYLQWSPFKQGSDYFSVNSGIKFCGEKIKKLLYFKGEGLVGAHSTVFLR